MTSEEKPKTPEEKMWEIIHASSPDPERMAVIRDLFSVRGGTPLVRVIPFKRKK